MTGPTRAAAVDDILEWLEARVPCEELRWRLLAELKTRPPALAAEPVARAVLTALSYVLRPRDSNALVPCLEDAVAHPRDLPQEVMDTLDEHIDRFPPELRARIRDMHWERSRDATSARAAARDYLKLADGYRAVQTAAAAGDRFDRAFSLGKLMKDESILESATKTAEAYVQDATVPTNARVWVAVVLIERGTTDQLVEIARMVSDQAAAAIPTPGVPGDWEWPRYLWGVAAQAYESAGMTVEAVEMKKRRAHSFKDHADWLSESTNRAFMRADLLRRGVQAFRAIGGCRAESDALLNELAAARPAVLESMTPFQMSPPRDIAEQRTRAAQAVGGLEWRAALARLARLVPSPAVAQLRADAEEQKQLKPLSFLFGEASLDEEGRQVAVHSGGQLDAHLLRVRSMIRSYLVYSTIEPARERVAAEHPAVVAQAG